MNREERKTARAARRRGPRGAEGHGAEAPQEPERPEGDRPPELGGPPPRVGPPPPQRATKTPSRGAAGAPTLLSDQDLYLFNEGSHFELYEHLGAHPMTVDGRSGTYFAVWAPNAERVAVMGTFNGWSKSSHPLAPRAGSGIWEGFLPGVERGNAYKFHIVSRSGYAVDKADPFAFRRETAPGTAAIVWDLDYGWGDDEWMRERGRRNALDAPMSIYEVHLGSWRRPADDPHAFLTYREIAELLIEHLRATSFTHVELLPISEHPFYGSWGYQTTGYFAPTSRYGSPQDLMHLIDRLHQAGYGVLLDWVPSHFPSDEHGLAYFDGTHLFEHADPRKGFQPDWSSYVFNYGRHEVRSFLVSSAIYWLAKYHFDGIRVDAVASMLYLDYSRSEGEWIPNEYGGRENLEAIAFLRRLNEEIYQRHPDVQTIAEESTSWPMVSRPTYVGGLGFGMKWDMGWMNDTLRHFERDPLYRGYHHNELTFRAMYAFHENFVLPMSHDEIVYGKRSLLEKMPGDDWRKFANLRLLFSYMYAQPGKKLIFMGGEFGQRQEWSHDRGLDWHLVTEPMHAGVLALVGDVNRVYRDRSELHELDMDSAGFEWVQADDSENSVLGFLRRNRAGRYVLAVFNLTPSPRFNYRLGVPTDGLWVEILNTDSETYGGSGHGNLGGVESAPVPSHGRPHSLNLTLPPLGGVYLACET